MNGTMLLGILLIIVGVVFFTATQFLLRRWIKKYNREWNERIENNEVS